MQLRKSSRRKNSKQVKGIIAKRFSNPRDMPENLYTKLPSTSLMCQESFRIETIRKYHQDIMDLKSKYHEKQRKYKNAYNKLLHASTGASSVGIIGGISTIGTAFTVVGIPISASLGVVRTLSTCVGGILLLASKKYKKKSLKCCEPIDKITSSLATFEALIGLSLNDDSIIDAKEFHKLQTLYFQVMVDVRNVDRKIEVQTEKSFQKTVLNEIKILKKRHGTKVLHFSLFAGYLIAYIIRIMESNHLHSGKLEFLTLKWSITEAFKWYLYHTPNFRVLTDNNPLTYVMSTVKLNVTGMQWVG